LISFAALESNLRSRVSTFRVKEIELENETCLDSWMHNIPKKGELDVIEAISRFSEIIARRWCYLTHPDPMWPVKGMYRCPKCHRLYPVPWEEKPAAARPALQPYCEPVFAPIKEEAVAN
jgi:hypothetical protein